MSAVVMYVGTGAGGLSWECVREIHNPHMSGLPQTWGTQLVAPEAHVLVRLLKEKREKHLKRAAAKSSDGASLPAAEPSIELTEEEWDGCGQIGLRSDHYVWVRAHKAPHNEGKGEEQHFCYRPVQRDTLPPQRTSNLRAVVHALDSWMTQHRKGRPILWGIWMRASELRELLVTPSSVQQGEAGDTPHTCPACGRYVETERVREIDAAMQRRRDMAQRSDAILRQRQHQQRQRDFERTCRDPPNRRPAKCNDKVGLGMRRPVFGWPRRARSEEAIKA